MNNTIDFNKQQQEIIELRKIQRFLNDLFKGDDCAIISDIEKEIDRLK